MALVPKLATKAMKKPAFKNVRSMVEAKAAARKEASTFKTVDQLKKEAIAAKPSTTKAVAPSSSEAARKQKSDTRLLVSTGSMFTAGAAYEKVKQKKGAPTAEAKGRRGGRTGYAAGPAESKASVSPAKPAATAPKAKDGNTTAPSPKAKVLGGREVKNGKVFVSAEELKKSGLSLRDFLNKERGLTRREDKSKLKPLKSVAEDRKALDEAAAKKKAREEEVKKMVAAAGLAKGGMPKKWSK